MIKYQYTDEVLSKLHKRITRLFSRYESQLKFDELNVIKSTKTLYKELNKLNKQFFLDIALKAYEEVNPESEDIDKIDKDWLMAMLLAYGPVTKYIYEHEVERKQARLAEAVVASSEYGGNVHNELVTARNLWLRQTNQMAIEITDTATLDGYKDKGVTHVQWLTTEDNKVCKECAKRHGEVYPIDEVPPKPHYYCRCWLLPYKGGEEE